jgi:hypothetical protein
MIVFTEKYGSRVWRSGGEKYGGGKQVRRAVPYDASLLA